MEIPVLVEPIPGGYRAKAGEPLTLAAEGVTSDEAIQTLQALIAQRLAGWARLVSITVPEHPWSRLAGMFEDDPLFDEWQRATAERRRDMDNEPDVP
jgi:hypothetical protein